MRGADLHVHSYYYMYLLRARIRLKLAQAEGMKKAGVGFDVRRQQREEIRRRYRGEAKNRFEVLGDIEDPEEEHNRILETYSVECCKECYQVVEKQSKPWIGEKT